MKVKMQRLYQIIKRRVITGLVFPPILLLPAFNSYGACHVEKSPVLKKELKIETVFQNIRIEGDILLVLTNAPAGTIIIEGKKKDVQKINPVFENNVLIIDANRKRLFAKLTIYLSAIKLQTIQLNGDGDILSTEFLHSGRLHLSLNGNINVSIKTFGQLSFDAADDIEIRVKQPSTALKMESNLLGNKERPSKGRQTVVL